LDLTKPLITCTATSALAVSRPKPVARATVLAEGTTSHPAMTAERSAREWSVNEPYMASLI